MTWQSDLLAGWGAPGSPTNVEALTLWAQGEGTTDDNNPLAISGKFAGCTRCLAQCDTPSPVFAYVTMAAGIAATVAFTEGSNSAGIVQAFREDAGLAAIFEAINRSGWCAGCQGGRYPEPLWAAVQEAPPAPAPNPQPQLEDFFDMFSDPAFAVRFLYRMCLHREVDPGGMATFEPLLASGKLTLDQLMGAIEDSAEGQAAIVAERKALGLG